MFEQIAAPAKGCITRWYRANVKTEVARALHGQPERDKFEYFDKA
jgi:hypothetical protein